MSRTENCREPPFTSLACAGSHVGLCAVDITAVKNVRPRLDVIRGQSPSCVRQLDRRHRSSQRGNHHVVNSGAQNDSKRTGSCW